LAEEHEDALYHFLQPLWNGRRRQGVQPYPDLPNYHNPEASPPSSSSVVSSASSVGRDRV
jgi:hypothetical protein